MSTGTMQVKDASARYSATPDAQYVPLGYKRTEVGVIPLEWEVKSVRELGQIKTGPFGTLLKAEEYSDTEGVPLISVGEVGAGVFKISDRTPCVPEAVIRRLPQYVLRTGDIVFGRKGAVDRSALVTERQDGWFLGSDGISIRPLKTCFAPYLAWQFQRHEVQAWLLQNAIGTTMASLNQGVLNRVQIPYAPAPEQRAIAEALSDVGGLIGSLEALIVKKRAIKQAAMQQLLTGKTRLPGFSGTWEAKRIDDLAAVDPENLSSSTDRNYSFNYISLEQVDAGQLLGVSEEAFRTSPSRARRVLRHDDVLMSTVRPNLMAHFYFRSQIANAVCSTGFAVLRAHPSVAAPGFLFAHLFGYIVNQQIEKTLAGSSYPAINGGDVRMIKVSCPPTVDEQQAIATVLSDVDAEITALEQRRDKTRALKQGMMQQLLTGRVRLVEPTRAPAEANA